MKRILALFLTALLIVGSVSDTTAAQPPQQGLKETLLSAPLDLAEAAPQMWFVEFNNPPLGEGGSQLAILSDKNNFHSQARMKGLQYSLRLEFSALWNGVSIAAQASELNKLSRLASVKAIYPIVTFSIPEKITLESPEMNTALGMIGADIVHELGFKGHGIKVGVIDTGIDYTHPDLGGCFGAGCRVITGWDFVGDSFNANPASPTYNPAPTPNGDPLDCNGHGTHVAGIVGAMAEDTQEGVTGVAPEASLGAYKVFGCDGSTTADIMLAAMEMALADGMDVVNMSIGAPYQWPQYPTAVAASNLVELGVVVVASIGNNGSSGVYSASAPGLGENVIGVASFDNLALGGMISFFSSYGLSPDLVLKPDLGAPGGGIRSTYPLAISGGYATISGTSMASPQVAGAAALLLEAGIPTHDVRTILQNSANPQLWWKDPSLGHPETVHRQGAGLLDIPGAIQATTQIEPSRLSLGESEAGPITSTLTIRNTSTEVITYTLSHKPAVATSGNTYSPLFTASFATVAFGAPSLSIGSDASKDLEVTITAPATPLGGQYGGYIVFTPEGDGQIYHVPYAGYIGDYQSIQVLTPTSYGFPWLANLEDGSFDKQEEGATYTMEGDDVPFILAHFDHQSQKVILDVIPQGELEKHYNLELNHYEYFSRNHTSLAFFYFEWDGTVMDNLKKTKLPNGDYRLRLRVLKALGEEENPDHWETWTSPIITINRTSMVYLPLMTR
jgi:subtilisin family serine protease